MINLIWRLTRRFLAVRSNWSEKGASSAYQRERIRRKLALGRGPVDAPALVSNDRWSLAKINTREGSKDFDVGVRGPNGNSG